MSVFYDLSKTPRNILNQAIVRAIVSENNGAWFDPSDLSTLYQDAGGTTPVTAAEQPVGKMLDKSGNGYHATQSITASRPTLSARYNLLSKTEDFSNSAWVKEFGGVGSTPVVTQNYATAPDGTMTATRIVYALNGGTATADYSRVYQTVTLRANTQTSLGVWVKSANGQTKDISISMTGSDPKVVSVGVDWVFVSNTMIRSDTNYLLRFELRGTFGTSDSADILIWHPDLRIGSTPGQYQRVITVTDYDTDERYFKKYLRFDGVDDYLNLPCMGMYANGSASVVMAKSADYQTGNPSFLAETSSVSKTPAYQLLGGIIQPYGLGAYIMNDAGTAVANTKSVLSADVQSAAHIATMVDNGSLIKRFNNSSNVDSDSYARINPLTVDRTVIGAFYTIASIYNKAVMNLYGLVITKSALTDSQRVACERYLSRKSGAQL